MLDISHFPTFDEAEGIPYLVVEIATLFAESFVEKDVVASRSSEHHTHTHTVCAELLDEFEWVRRVAERFRHLATDFVAHDTSEIYVAERHIAFVFVASHNHTSHPEEDDVGTCNEVGSWVVVVDFVVVRIVDAIEQRDWPQP